jgi:hypothetical protein
MAEVGGNVFRFGALFKAKPFILTSKIAFGTHSKHCEQSGEDCLELLEEQRRRKKNSPPEGSWQNFLFAKTHSRRAGRWSAPRRNSTQPSTVSLIVVVRRYGVVPLTRTANGRLVE